MTLTLTVLRWQDLQQNTTTITHPSKLCLEQKQTLLASAVIAEVRHRAQTTIHHALGTRIRLDRNVLIAQLVQQYPIP